MSSYFDRYTDSHWDHERDLRKHDTPSRHQPAHRLDTPISPAVEVAMAVKAMKNIAEAAKLIEQYADTRAAERRLEAVAAGANP